MNGTPQTLPLRDAGGRPLTVQNSAGGQSFRITDEDQLLRFLILGSTSGTYYAGNRSTTALNVDALLRMIANEQGPQAVALIRSVSQAGRAPRQTPTLTALAICSTCGDKDTARAAHEALPDVARTPTMLFEYLDLRSTICKAVPTKGRGWGRAHRTAVAKWYTDCAAALLAQRVTKYPKRHGYTHADALSLCHASAPSPEHAVVFGYTVGGIDRARKVAADQGVSDDSYVMKHLYAVTSAKRSTDPDALVPLLTQSDLQREHVPTQLLKYPSVWISLLPGMPMNALVRSLGKLTAVGVLAPDSEHVAAVVARLCNAKAVANARVHPMAIMLAHRTYASGCGDKGALAWKPVSEVLAALDVAFENAFDAVEPAGKRTMVALDVSGSMAAPCNGGSQGAQVTCAEAAAAMALITMRTEPECTAMCFTRGFSTFPLTRQSTLTDAIQEMRNKPFGATDCAQPMQYALKMRMLVDTFVVYTDSETYYGDIHPCEALCRYRDEMNVPHARLVVVGMASNGFTIARPSDPGMLDVVGFDAAAPSVIARFSGGNLG